VIRSRLGRGEAVFKVCPDAEARAMRTRPILAARRVMDGLL
jgi:hypothetical protein